MATFYFYGGEDTHWNTLGNWWQDSDGTVAATSLPTSSDDVYVAGGQLETSDSAVTIANLTWDTFSPLALSMTVTGVASFSQGSNEGAITGNAAFYFGSHNGGTVTGNATFTDYSSNNVSGTVSGNATFNSVSSNEGIVTGNATFNDSSFATPFSSVNGVASHTLSSVSSTLNYIANYGSLVLVYDKGINGSSILGVV